MKTNLLKTFFVALFLFGATIVTAHDFEVDGIYYSFTDYKKTAVKVVCRGNSAVEYSNEYIGNIVIPESITYKGSTYSVVEIGNGAFTYCTSLTSITVPQSVTSIREGAFYGCTALKQVSLPTTIKEIEYCTFHNCTSLSDIKIPSSVTNIGNLAFEGCCSLTNIEIPNNVTSIGERAFSGCSNVTSVTIGGNVTKIGYMAFNGCYLLKELYFKDGMSILELGYKNLDPYGVGSGLFDDSPLEKLYLGRILKYENGAEYGYSPFYNKSGLKTIIISNAIGGEISALFKGCNSIKYVYVLSSQPLTIANVFYSCGSSAMNLYIPYGTISKYKSTTPWNGFTNYIEYNKPAPTHKPVTLYMPDITGAISRWEYSKDGGASWTNIECEEYCYTETEPERGEVLYRVLKTDGTYGNILTINYYDSVPEVIATSPATETKTVDESVTFTLNVKDDGYTYQWMLNNMAIKGATNSRYSIPAIKMTDAGEYFCVVSNPVSCVNSTSSILTVNKCPQIITFPEIETKTFGDEAFTLPATTDKGLTINYQSTNTNVATVEGNVVTIKEPGETNIIATQAGNDDYLEAAYVSRKLTVKKVSQTIVLNELQDKTFEDIPFMLPATTDKGLTISYQSTNTNVATIEGNVVTIVGAGTTDIIATQQGDEHHYATTPVSRTLTVNRQTQSITFNAFGNIVYGDAQIELNQYTNKNFEITYTSSNTDVATVDGNIISVIKPGVTVIKAIQNGNKNYLPAQSIERTLIVNKAEQKIEWHELPAKKYGDDDFALPKTTDKGLTISYTSDNEDVATINGNIVSIKNAGSTNITATQSGDDYYNAATAVTQILTVSKITQSITFEELPVMTFGDTPIELNATASSSNEVLFESSDETVATISGKTLTVVGAGSCIITASCAGDNNYYTAIPVERVLVVNKAGQTITIAPLNGKRYGDEPFELNVTTNNNRPVVLTSSDASVLSIKGTTATIRAAGNVTITALQEATDEYEKAETQIGVVISKAKLTATVSNAERVYGDANPNFEITYSGFVNGETKEDLDVMPVAMCSATEFSNVGEYDITINNVSNKNYILDIRNAKLTIKKALLTVAADNRTKIYGEKNPALSVSYSGFKNNENETILSSSAVAFTDAKTMSNVGEYVIMVEGANSINYDFEYKQGVFVIEKAQLIITAENKSINYQDEIPMFTILYDGFVGNDSEADLDELPQIVCDITNETMPGTYDIVLSGGYDNNYEYVLVDGIIVINNTTGITNIESGSENNVVYNLKGQRVIDTENLTRGFYIINGKKVFIK